MSCKARQYSDQMLCACGLAWDVNDADPPPCPQGKKPEQPAPPKKRRIRIPGLSRITRRK